MLRLTCLLVLFFTGLSLSSCTEETDPNLPVTGIDVEQLVEEYNSEIDPKTAKKSGAFVATGKITEADVLTNNNGEEQLTFTFVSKEARRTFDFYLEDEVDFPEEIDRAKVVFLGHQMIVADLNGDFFVHLLVANEEGKENLLPELPFVEGNGLAQKTNRGLLRGLLN